MKKLLLCVFAACLVTSCCRQAYPTKEVEKVVTRTEYVEKIRIDTVTVELPQESKEVVTKDTVSHLSIGAAFSDAMVKGGLLYHSLKTDPSYKPKIEVRVKETIEVRDSLVYVNKVVEVDMPRTKYEKFCISAFWVMLSILVIFVGLKIYLAWKRF